MSLAKNMDELLVAYIDNELNPAERAEVSLRLSHDSYMIERLAFIERSSLPFKKAFEPLLHTVPQKQLHRHLHIPKSAVLTRRSLIAIAASFLALGVIGDRTLLHFFAPEENWRELVAQYMSLYTPDTLAETPDAQALDAQLSSTGKQLGLTLAGANLVLPNATLKNARVLAYDERRIAQITWLDKANGPLALCITQKSGKIAAPQSERRLGMNIVYWASSRHQFMVIGHNSAAQLKAFAAKLQGIEI